MDSADPARTSARLSRLLASQGRFLAFLERRVGSRALAEEILQDAYARSVEKVDAIRDDESVVAWFYRLLRNAAADVRRRTGAAERAHAALAGDALALALPEPSPDMRDAVCTCVTAVLDTLKPEYAAAIRQVDLEDRSVADFAGTAGILPGNAAVRLHRARRALGRELRATCGACAEHGCADCTCRRPTPTTPARGLSRLPP